MTSITSLQTVVKAGLCSGCGLCESIAGCEFVEMQITSAGYIRPVVKQALPPEVLNRALAVCPGISVTGPRSGKNVDLVWGPIHGAWRSWASSSSIRYKGAAGGSLTALGCYLLDSKQVDAIVHVKASTTKPMLTTALVSRSSEDVISGAQSRYGPAAPLVTVHELLRLGLRLAIIAKPCDIAAVRNLMKIDSIAERQIYYCLSIFCGGTPSLRTAEAIATYHGVAPDKVKRFRWRGDGWPGRIRIEADPDIVREMTYEQAWHTPGVPWSWGSSVQFRCKICPDAEGETADVSCPDGWLLKNGKPTYDDAPGLNLALARTAKGHDLLRQAEAAGYIQLGHFNMTEMEAIHGEKVPRKLGHSSRSLALLLMGQTRLKVKQYRSFRKMLAAGLRTNLEAFFGTIKRIQNLANREPLN